MAGSPIAGGAIDVPPGGVTVGTVQFLPGRLEVLQGRGIAEQEVRFVRPARSGQAPEVTFGRGEGPRPCASTMRSATSRARASRKAWSTRRLAAALGRSSS